MLTPPPSPVSTEIYNEERWAYATKVVQNIQIAREKLHPYFNSIISQSFTTFELSAENYLNLSYCTIDYANDPFFAALLMRIQKGNSITGSCCVRTCENIVIPDDHALRCLVDDIAFKYTIPMVVINHANLDKAISYFRLATQTLLVNYIGIIVIESQKGENHNWFHAVPVMYYLEHPAEEDTQPYEEFVLMDGLRFDQPLCQQVFQTLGQMNVKGRVLYTNQCLQKYLHTGRTAATMLIQSALLDLKLNGITSRLSVYLSDYLHHHAYFIQDPDQLSDLPYAWTYLQDFPSVKSCDLPITHGFFSKKTSSPPTTAEHRYKKRVWQKVICDFTVFGKNLEPLFNTLDADEMGLKKDNNQYQFSFPTTLLIDNYVADKGREDQRHLVRIVNRQAAQKLKAAKAKSNENTQKVEARAPIKQEPFQKGIVKSIEKPTAMPPSRRSKRNRKPKRPIFVHI